MESSDELSADYAILEAMDDVRKWRAPLPRVLTAKPFSVAEAITAGISPKQLRRDGLDRPFRGIRSMGHDLTRLEVLCRAYSVHMLSTHVFSHVTAARLMGLPLPLPLEQAPELHVSAAAPGRAPQVNGVVGHQFSGGAVVTHRGLRITGPELTWVSLAPMLTLRDLVAVGDALVEGDYPWTTIDKLRAAIIPGIRGTVKLRKAVQLIRLGVRSRPETHLRLAILGAGLPEPTVAHPVWVPLLQRHLHPDLSWPEWKVGLEYEGEDHRKDRWQFRHDITRVEAMVDINWSLSRFSADDVYSVPPPALARARLRLEAHGWVG
ncbi:MAG TPA: hypothetical protein VFT01_01615 [Homoserinimonas sp.]|nr:hypothetical protein [Homoserinimonas sp.]